MIILSLDSTEDYIIIYTRLRRAYSVSPCFLPPRLSYRILFFFTLDKLTSSFFFFCKILRSSPNASKQYNNHCVNDQAKSYNHCIQYNMFYTIKILYIIILLSESAAACQAATHRVEQYTHNTDQPFKRKKCFFISVSYTFGGTPPSKIM